MNEVIGSTIIPIDKNGKYIIKIPEKVSSQKKREIMDLLDEWMKGTQPFAIVTGEWEIVEIGSGAVEDYQGGDK